MTNFNERTNTLLYKKYNLSHFILERVMLVVCERWGRDGDRLLFWPKILLVTIIALLSHLGWVAQPWVTGWRLSIRHLVSNWLKPSVCWLYHCLTSTCFRRYSAYLHRCISWLTAQSRVNMLQVPGFESNWELVAIFENSNSKKHQQTAILWRYARKNGPKSLLIIARN